MPQDKVNEIIGKYKKVGVMLYAPEEVYDFRGTIQAPKNLHYYWGKPSSKNGYPFTIMKVFETKDLTKIIALAKKVHWDPNWDSIF